MRESKSCDARRETLVSKNRPNLDEQTWWSEHITCLALSSLKVLQQISGEPRDARSDAKFVLANLALTICETNNGADIVPHGATHATRVHVEKLFL